MVAPGEANKRLTENTKEKLGDRMFIASEKLQHILRNLEGHTPGQGCPHAQERPGNALPSYSQPILRPCKQEVSTRAELQVACWGMDGTTTDTHGTA